MIRKTETSNIPIRFAGQRTACLWSAFSLKGIVAC